VIKRLYVTLFSPSATSAKGLIEKGRDTALSVTPALYSVTSAKAGVQKPYDTKLDSRFRGNDKEVKMGITREEQK